MTKCRERAVTQILNHARDVNRTDDNNQHYVAWREVVIIWQSDRTGRVGGSWRWRELFSHRYFVAPASLFSCTSNLKNIEKIKLDVKHCHIFDTPSFV